MIFIGDIALPKVNSIEYNLPSFFKKKTIIANLEGALVEETEDYLKSSKVVNEVNAIKKIHENYNVHFSINNNHIFDNNDFYESRLNFNKLGLSVFGAGENIEIASKPLILHAEKIIVLNFGWSVIECKYASKIKEGVNPLIHSHVKNEFIKYKNLYSGFKIFIFFHWNYELEAFPMPIQRILSYELIDLGCDLIIGAHPHRVQGFEYYKNKPIIYSLGNFLFAQNIYRSGTLNFPDFCNLELAFEYSLKGDHKFHFFNYNRDNNKLEFLKTESISDSEIMEKLSCFKNIKLSDYDKWFKANRYHKKIIPIYRTYDSKLIVLAKNYFNQLRTIGVNLISSLVRKFILK